MSYLNPENYFITEGDYRMSTLFELTEEVKHLYEAEDVTDEEIQAVVSQVKTKGEGIAKLVESMKADEKALAEEIQYLTDKKKTIADRMARIKQYTKECMKEMGLKKLEAGIFTLAIQKNSKSSVLISIPAVDLPEDYQKVIIEPDKQQILEDYKEDLTTLLHPLLESGEIKVVTGTHLRIR